MSTTATQAQQDERQTVVFVLANEHYGVDVSVVLEIIRMVDVTPMPAAPDFVKGMINLRGRVIPVVDLRERFGFPAGAPDKDSRILVVEVAGEDIGIIVDAVSEVIRIPADSIEPAAFAAAGDRATFVEGIANTDGKLIILLDLAAALARSAQ